MCNVLVAFFEREHLSNCGLIIDALEILGFKYQVITLAHFRNCPCGYRFSALHNLKSSFLGVTHPKADAWIIATSENERFSEEKLCPKGPSASLKERDARSGHVLQK